MFSPYYALARRRGPADPLRFSAMNAVVYGPRGRFALTERGRGAVERDVRRLAIGRSSLAFEGSSLVAEIDEVAAPIPRRVRGRIRLTPSGFTDGPFALDAAGRHRWWPIAPASRVEVSFANPAMSWRGEAYLDTNAGDRPLEADFSDWSWSRAPTRGGASILYDVRRSDGTERGLWLSVCRSGRVDHREPPPRADLPPGRIWRVPRPTRCDAGDGPRVIRAFEDAPFYTRSEIETRLFGERGRAVHESLSMRRFTAPWVQMMLPFRMPRAFWRG